MLIRRPSEIISKTTIAALVYGQSGMGKTTLAASAPAPVLFDFDGGVDRLRDEHQVPTVQVTSFADALAALEEVKQSNAAAPGTYQTIIIDTASKLIDCITYDTCGTATPKINQYGIINTKFKAFTRSIMEAGINVLYVAQREVEKDGEVTRYVPQFRASNYKDVICDLDICGYMEMQSVRGRSTRVLTFDPTPRSEGKNTGGFDPSYVVPTLAAGQPNTILTTLFEQYVDRQRAKNDRRRGVTAEVLKKAADFQVECDTATDADSINQLMQVAMNTTPEGDLVLRMKKAVNARAQQLGLTFNKEDKLYE